jgi:hypothetical protein
MKNLVVTLFLFLVATVTVNAQKAKKTVSKPKTKTVKSKTTANSNKVELEMLIKQDDGSTTFEKLKTGDKLIYEVNAGGSTYSFIVTLNKANAKDGYDFNYEMTNENNTKGHVSFSKETLWETRNYVNYFKGGELALKDAVSVWLSGINFSEMPDKKTEIALDYNAPQTYYRPENDEYAPTINFKGKSVKIDGFFINNAVDGKGDKTIYIHNTSANTLILKMDVGFTIELKEIR